MSSSLYSRLADQGGLEDKGQQDRYRAVSAMAVASLVLGLR
jgi:hypothetical protein